MSKHPDIRKVAISQPQGVACCGTCACFTGPKEVSEHTDVTMAALPVFTHGACRRYPTLISKLPEDHCFEWRLDATQSSEVL